MNDVASRGGENTRTSPGARVGIALGSFDMFHVGHLAAIRRARAAVDRIVLAVADDDLVRSVRGSDAVVSCAERVEVLEAFFPDAVIAVVADTDVSDLVARHEVDVVFVCGPSGDAPQQVRAAPSVVALPFETTSSVSLQLTLEPEILWTPR